MFNRHLKERISALEKENASLKDQMTSLNDEVGSLQAENNHLLEQAHSPTNADGDDLPHLLLGSSELVDDIRQALANSSTELVEHRDSFEASQALFGDIISMLSSTVSSTKRITNDAGSAVEAVDVLKEATSGISDFVAIIKGISDQTNLLALNAAIEAARAGEQGRGFAVVADEVRTLAQRSSDASNEISTLIEQVSSQMEGVINGIGNVGNQSQEINESTTSIEETANQIVDLSQQMFGVINNSTSDSFIQTVKMDHIVWKLDVYKHFYGMSDSLSGEVNDHQNCRLGQWFYHGEGAEKYSSFSAFKAMEKPHEDVHKHGLAALDALAAGDKQKAIDKLAQMESSSNDVINHLSQLSQQISS